MRTTAAKTLVRIAVLVALWLGVFILASMLLLDYKYWLDAATARVSQGMARPPYLFRSDLVLLLPQACVVLLAILLRWKLSAARGIPRVALVGLLAGLLATEAFTLACFLSGFGAILQDGVMFAGYLWWPFLNGILVIPAATAAGVVFVLIANLAGKTSTVSGIPRIVLSSLLGGIVLAEAIALYGLLWPIHPGKDYWFPFPGIPLVLAVLAIPAATLGGIIYGAGARYAGRT